MYNLGIVGFGNLGKSAEAVIGNRKEINLVGVFTRRPKESVRTKYSKIYSLEELDGLERDIDCILICQGSKDDTPSTTPVLLRKFNTVDTYDNHKEIVKYKTTLSEIGNNTKHTSVIGAGWDPGLLSLLRGYIGGLLPSLVQNTFWGEGVSQGHTEALKRVENVKNALQITLPKEEMLIRAENVCELLSDTEKHKRVCYIVAEKKNEDRIKTSILGIENYFSGYECEFVFLSEDEFAPLFEKRGHRGRIIAGGTVGEGTFTRALFDIEMQSNPDLTAEILVSSALACIELNKKGRYGAYSLLDIPPSMLFGFSYEKYL